MTSGSRQIRERLNWRKKNAQSEPKSDAVQIGRSMQTQALIQSKPVEILLALLVAASLLGGATACDPGHSVEYQNRTDKRLEVLINGRPEVTLGPFEKQNLDLLEFRGTQDFEARDEDGRVVYFETFTWAQLKKRGWKIVITEAAPTGGSPTPIEAQ